MASDMEQALKLLDGPHGINFMAKKGSSVIGGHSNSIPMLVKRLSDLPTWDVYVCLNPSGRLDKPKPAIEDIKEVRRFLIDIDPVDKNYRCSDMFEAVLRWTLPHAGFANQDMTVIHSGRGVQLWVPIIPPVDGRPMPPNHELAAGIKGLISQLAAAVDGSGGCRIDTSCAEISRVARLPGTFNQKSGKLAQIISVESSPEPGIRGDKLVLFAEQEQNPIEPLPPGTFLRLDTILSALPGWARDFILLGVDGSVDSRHGKGYATVRALQDLGVDHETATHLLSVGCMRCKPRLDDMDWMVRTIGRVYGKRES